MALLNRAGTMRDWTKHFSLILVLAVLTLAFAFIAVVDSNRPSLVHVLLLGFVIVASVRAGAAGGLVVGLVGAALHIAVGTINDGWGSRGTALSVIVICSFLFYGWIFGLSAAYFRRQHDVEARQAATVGAGHSQGLLTGAEGRVLLDMEVERARRSGGHLAVLIVTATVREGAGRRQAAHAFRAIARTFEAAASDHQYPVLVTEGKLAMVMPGGDRQDGYHLEQSLLPAMSEATYADREAGTRPRASTVLILDSSVVLLTESLVEAETVFSLPERRTAQAGRPMDVSTVSDLASKTAA